MFDTILVAVDASDQRGGVLLHAAEITRRFSANLHLVSVYDIDQMWETKVPEPSPEIFETLATESKKPLAEAQRELSAMGIASQCHFLEGPVIEQIAILAQRLDADLVIMGHRHVTGLRRLLESSAAKGLIDKSPCSVMIVRDGKPV
ncbi:universal stress protein [Desulfobulbus sp.]|uniref:universal stress protein n=1 Tax=Desulfobulbus sp. TaxID=895 RepID=UPI00286EE880|nr:universal stress protein [Desulfobulbus sp.]